MERSFNSIINFIVGQNNVSAALDNIDSRLAIISNNARVAGQSLDQLLAKTAQLGGGGGVTLRPAGPQEAEARAIRAQYDEFLRRTYGTGMTGAASINPMGAAMGIPGGRTEYAGTTANYEQWMAERNPSGRFQTRAFYERQNQEYQRLFAPSAGMAAPPPTFAGATPGGAGAAPMPPSVKMGEWSGDWQKLSVAAIQYYRMTGQNLPLVEKMAQAQDKVDASNIRTGRSFSTMVGHIVTGMLVWQGMNMVMNTIIGAFNTVYTETIRLDTASAALSVTLNTTKENARGYAQAMSMMGVAYGMAPEQTLALTEYAARVGKGAGAPNQQTLFGVAGKLGVVTGEDPKKLMDDLNVTYRQTGISVTQLGDMSAKAFQNSGTSASEYLNILREVGPLAKEAGIDIERMAGISAQAADRMGGSMSDAANTLTRLIKAVTDPNETQRNVLLRYGIPYGPGTDVQRSLTQVAGVGMTAADLAALGGRPGQPAVANDIRTMISTMMTYNGELQKGVGLQEQFAKHTDSAAFSVQQIGSAFKALPGLILGSIDQSKILSDILKEIANSIAGTGAQIGLKIPGIGQVGIGLKGMQTAAQEALNKAPYTGGMYQPGMQGQNVVMPGIKEEEGRKTFVPESIPDFSNMINVSNRTSAEVRSALGMIPAMFKQEELAMGRVYKQAGFSQQSIDQMLEDFRNKVNASNVVIQSGGQMQMLQGPQAYYFQQALQASTARAAQEDRLASLRDRLASLRDRLASLQDALASLDDTEKKRAQLEGQWNIPAGAKILAPLTAESQALIKEHGGETDDQAKERQRQNILKQIAAVEAQIAKEEALGTALDNLPPSLTGVTTATGGFTRGLQDATASAIAFGLALSASPAKSPLGKAMEDKSIGKAIDLLNNPPPAPALHQPLTPGVAEPPKKDLTGGFDWGSIMKNFSGQQATGLGSTPVFAPITATIKEGFTNLAPPQVSVNVKSLPVNITYTAVLDGTVLFQDTQRKMVQQVTDQARSTGFYSGPTAQ